MKLVVTMSAEIIIARLSLEECRYADNQSYLPKEDEESLKYDLEKGSHKEIFFKGIVEPWKKEGFTPTKNPSVEFSYEKLRLSVSDVAKKNYCTLVESSKLLCILLISTVALHILATSFTGTTIILSLCLTVCKIARFVSGVLTLLGIKLVYDDVQKSRSVQGVLSALPLDGSDNEKRAAGLKVLTEYPNQLDVVREACSFYDKR